MLSALHCLHGLVLGVGSKIRGGRNIRPGHGPRTHFATVKLLSRRFATIAAGLLVLGAISLGMPAQAGSRLIGSTPGQIQRSVLATGGSSACSLSADGTVRCWGNNNTGQLGDGTQITRLTPVTVSGLTNVAAVSAGGLHACALRTDGTVRCWGNNNNGQLGDGTTVLRRLPVTVSGLSNVVAVAASSQHTCALQGSGSVRCWGNNTGGQLGDNSRVNRLTPVAVSGLNDAVVIEGGTAHSCAIRAGGSLIPLPHQSDLTM